MHDLQLNEKLHLNYANTDAMRIEIDEDVFKRISISDNSFVVDLFWSIDDNISRFNDN